MCNCKGYNFVIYENIIKILNMEMAGFDSWPSICIMSDALFSIQGLNLATFVHASRALSEQREMAINSIRTAKTELW